jgi:hypothetical protein
MIFREQKLITEKFGEQKLNSSSISAVASFATDILVLILRACVRLFVGLWGGGLYV